MLVNKRLSSGDGCEKERKRGDRGTGVERTVNPRFLITPYNTQ